LQFCNAHTGVCVFTGCDGQGVSGGLIQRVSLALRMADNVSLQHGLSQLVADYQPLAGLIQPQMISTMPLLVDFKPLKTKRLLQDRRKMLGLVISGK
jgi:hypothetical protein